MELRQEVWGSRASPHFVCKICMGWYVWGRELALRFHLIPRLNCKWTAVKRGSLLWTLHYPSCLRVSHRPFSIPLPGTSLLLPSQTAVRLTTSMLAPSLQGPGSSPPLWNLQALLRDMEAQGGLRPHGEMPSAQPHVLCRTELAFSRTAPRDSVPARRQNVPSRKCGRLPLLPWREPGAAIPIGAVSYGFTSSLHPSKVNILSSGHDGGGLYFRGLCPL